MLTQLKLQHATVHNHTPVLPTPYTHDVSFNLQSPNLNSYNTMLPFWFPELIFCG